MKGFEKGYSRFYCERELETEQNCNILTLTLLTITVFLSRSLGLLNRGPEGPLCWVLAFSTTSCHQRVWSPKLTDFLSSPSYIIVQSPTQYLWNGMFDRHQAEITVVQFTGHSLPVHQSMTVSQDFTLSHIVSQARLRQWNMQRPRLWNGMFGRVEGQYTTFVAENLL